jgi:hypothetical protein
MPESNHCTKTTDEIMAEIRDRILYVGSEIRKIILAKERLAESLGQSEIDPIPLQFNDYEFKILITNTNNVPQEHIFFVNLTEGQMKAMPHGKLSPAQFIKGLDGLLPSIDTGIVLALYMLQCGLNKNFAHLAELQKVINDPLICAPGLGCCTYGDPSNPQQLECVTKTQCLSPPYYGNWGTGPCLRIDIAGRLEVFEGRPLKKP